MFYIEIDVVKITVKASSSISFKITTKQYNVFNHLIFTYVYVTMISNKVIYIT